MRFAGGWNEICLVKVGWNLLGFNALLLVGVQKPYLQWVYIGSWCVCLDEFGLFHQQRSVCNMWSATPVMLPQVKLLKFGDLDRFGRREGLQEPWQEKISGFLWFPAHLPRQTIAPPGRPAWTCHPLLAERWGSQWRRDIILGHFA